MQLPFAADIIKRSRKKKHALCAFDFYISVQEWHATSNVTSNYILGTSDSQRAVRWSEGCVIPKWYFALWNNILCVIWASHCVAMSLSSVIWCGVYWRLFTDVSEQLAVSIFKVIQKEWFGIYSEYGGSKLLRYAGNKLPINKAPCLEKL
jgi:hypothetical protein